MKEYLMGLVQNHPGKVLGVAAGFLAGLLLIFVGFWKSLVLLACIVGGYLLGVRADSRRDLQDLFRQVFGDRR